MKNKSPFLFLSVIGLFLLSCGDPKVVVEVNPLIPADSLIPKEKMVRMLVDIHIVEAGLAAKQGQGIGQKKLALQYYEGVFGRYRVSRKRYEDNLRYYRQDPGAFSKMYDEVIGKLTERQKNYDRKK